MCDLASRGNGGELLEMTKKKVSNRPSERDEERTIVRFILSGLFARDGDIKPDDAVQRLRIALSKMIAKVGNAPNWEALTKVGINVYPEEDLRAAHHMAVDMYYDKRFGKVSRGAPKHASLHLLTIAAKKWHKSYKEIADELGLSTTPLAERLESVDKIKKQVKAARERFPEFMPLAEAAPIKGKKRG
jgi:hypothetical protein